MGSIGYGMPPETLESLAYLKSKVQALEGKLTLEQAKKLVALPAQLGFSNTDEFLAAFREAIGAQERSALAAKTSEKNDAASIREPAPEGESYDSAAATGQATDVDETSERAESSPHRTSLKTPVADAGERARPTDQPLQTSKRRKPVSQEIRDEVKKLVESGKTQAEIAQELGLSTRQVQTARKAHGLAGKRTRGNHKNESAPSRTETSRRKTQ